MHLAGKHFTVRLYIKDNISNYKNVIIKALIRLIIYNKISDKFADLLH